MACSPQTLSSKSFGRWASFAYTTSHSSRSARACASRSRMLGMIPSALGLAILPVTKSFSMSMTTSAFIAASSRTVCVPHYAPSLPPAAVSCGRVRKTSWEPGARRLAAHPTRGFVATRYLASTTLHDQSMAAANLDTPVRGLLVEHDETGPRVPAEVTDL